jgi:hypothetical protein
MPELAICRRPTPNSGDRMRDTTGITMFDVDVIDPAPRDA